MKINDAFSGNTRENQDLSPITLRKTDLSPQNMNSQSVYKNNSHKGILVKKDN